MALIQYLKDTRGELRHVAWPTRVQTIVYTILVIAISVMVSLYLGFFDFLFTTGLGQVVEVLPGAAQPAAQIEGIETEPVTTPTPDINSLVPKDTQ